MKSFIFLLILNLLKTISVYSKQYLCSDINPNQSYCDSNHSCQKCLNADCQYCLSDLNTCTQCKNKFLFNKQCLFNSPQGTYCDPFTKICTKCKVDNCINCQANVSYCSQCDQQSNYIYLYQNNCLNTKNDYFDCDSLNVCSIQPPTYCTTNFQSCNYQTKVCYQCQNGFSKLISQPITLPSCVSSQPPNSSLIQGNYFQCPNLCPQCNRNFDCLQCQNTYYLQNGMCQICQNQNQGPNKSTQICELCQVLNCQNCIQDSSICNKCIDGQLFSGLKQLCSPQCNQCEDQNTCTPCGQNFYLKNKEYKCKQGYYDPINLICVNCESNTSKQACDQQIQNQCYYFNDQNKCVDMKNKNLYSNYKNECFEEKPASTYCRQEANNSTPFNTYLCRQCSVYCQECTGDSNIQCSSCVDGIILKDNTCEKKIEQVTQQAKITSQATVGSTIALSAVQNVFQSSSFAVVNSALNCQKLSFLILVNNNLPNQIFSPLHKVKTISLEQDCFDQIPNQTFCNENYECLKCENPDCLSDLNTCTQCINKYLYNNQCKDSQPQGTYCEQSTKICTKCKVDYCTDCQINVNACQQCDKQSQFLYLYLNKCLNFKPDYITCDSNNLCTTKPATYCTANCQSFNYLTKECYQSSNGFTKLLSQPPTLPTCVTSQPLNQSLQSQQFIQCPQFCSQYDNKFNCLQCQNNYYLLNKMCQICQQQNYGPNKSSQICEQCQVPNCQNCISDSSICNKCANGYFRNQNTCQPNHPISNYCDERNICIPCNNGCATCDKYGNCNTCSAGCVQCNDQNNCTACGQNVKIQNKECLCEKGYYFDVKLQYEFLLLELLDLLSIVSIFDLLLCQCYFFDDQNKCLDMKSQILYCNEQQQCYQMNPKNTYCLKDTSNTTPFNKYLCKQCHQLCQECTGSFNNECIGCIQDVILKNTTCEQLFLTYNSTVYTRDKIEQVTQQTQTASQTTIGSTYILSAAQNIFSSSSFAIITTGLTCQKLSHLILVNINLPNQIYSPLEKLKNQLPSQQFKTLNQYFQAFNKFKLNNLSRYKV
ncbi:hypothetical protein ABPG72_020146 [Tetrahymena utriculariae]